MPRTPSLTTASFLAGYIVVTVLLSDSEMVYACEAYPPGPPQEELEESETVFSGRAMEIQEGLRNGGEMKAVSFQVDRYWK